MTIVGFSHVNLRLRPGELDAVRDFYVEVLGLTVGYRPPFQSAGYWLYAGGSPLVHLVEAEAGSGRPADADNAIDHLAFVCSRPGQTKARLEQAGIPFEAARIPETGELQFFVRDPAGIRVELLFKEP